MTATAAPGSFNIAQIRAEQERLLDLAERLPEGSAQQRELFAEFDRLQAEKDELRGGVTGRVTTGGGTAPQPVTAAMTLIAYHEAAHAACAYLLGSHGTSATIVPQPNGNLGACTSETRLSPRDEATILAAGFFGESLAGVERPAGYSYGGHGDDELMERSGYHDLRGARLRAEQIVCANGLAVRALAGLLLQTRTITAADVASVFAAHPPRPW
jgi:hypothetical protein